jgi:hypothetical protein
LQGIICIANQYEFEGVRFEIARGREINGKLWSMIACVDYLVEIGFIREITNKDILAERVFVKGVKR